MHRNEVCRYRSVYAGEKYLYNPGWHHVCLGVRKCVFIDPEMHRVSLGEREYTQCTVYRDSGRYRIYLGVRR